MTAPTVEELKAASAVDFASLVPNDEVLQLLIDRSCGWFTSITGRPVDSTMPSEYEKMADACLQRMVEVAAYQRQPDQIETVADFMLISSFTASSYTETRRSLTEIKDAKMITGDPYLNQMLFGLLTPDQLDWWMAWWTGIQQPAFEGTEVAWGMTLLYPNDPFPVTGATYSIWSL